MRLLEPSLNDINRLKSATYTSSIQVEYVEYSMASTPNPSPRSVVCHTCAAVCTLTCIDM